MRAEAGIGVEWRDGASYAALLEADRSFFAWEWLRRDMGYRAAAARALSARCGTREADAAAEAFGLVGFEAPHLSVPQARPLWRSRIHPQVLAVERGPGDHHLDDLFALDRWGGIATLLAGDESEHLLLSDGLRAVRLDGPRGTFSAGAVCFRYPLEGLASMEPRLLTLRRLLALCSSGDFPRSLHQPEPRARRWIMMLRAWDGLAAGADQREIASELLSRSAGEPRWRSREPSARSQAQRLVRSARHFARGGFWMLLE